LTSSKYTRKTPGLKEAYRQASAHQKKTILPGVVFSFLKQQRVKQFSSLLRQFIGFTKQSNRKRIPGFSENIIL
jgi:hypothetical protein